MIDINTDTFFFRRNWLRASGLLGSAQLLGLRPLLAKTGSVAKTPALTPDEIAAIEAAMGKKGTYNEGQAAHTTQLPHNDLKVTLKGEPVPIPFGFGGWASIKKTLDEKSAVLMSDTVLLEEEVNQLISALHANGLEIGAIHNHFFYEHTIADDHQMLEVGLKLYGPLYAWAKHLQKEKHICRP